MTAPGSCEGPDRPAPARPLQGFVPVVTSHFPLDALLLPYLPRLAPGALVSATALQDWTGPAPAVPLMVDSGGFAALDSRVRVEEEGGLGVLVFADGTRLHPAEVHALQQRDAHTGFTLDFPCPASLGDAERLRRQRLSLANTAWALARPRRFLLYACVQPGEDSAPLLELHPDGLGLGGLVPHSRDPQRILSEVRRRRSETPLPLHALGVGQPGTLRAIFAAGVTSADSSSAQRHAADGRSLNGERTADPSAVERLRLALNNLRLCRDAAGHPLPHPEFRGPLGPPASPRS